jgi:hypothetical protein
VVIVETREVRVWTGEEHRDLGPPPKRPPPPVPPQSALGGDGLPTFHRWESPDGPRSIFYDVHVTAYRLRMMGLRPEIPRPGA